MPLWLIIVLIVLAVIVVGFAIWLIAKMARGASFGEALGSIGDGFGGGGCGGGGCGGGGGGCGGGSS